MLTFQVNDMTCGRCAGAITKAVKAVDRDATVTVDLARHLVQVQPGAADAQALSEAIAEAGYTPLQMEVRQAVTANGPRTGGCCCSSGMNRCG